MQIAKFLASAVMLSVPFTMVSGQSASQSDSSNHSVAGKWIAGSGAVGGAALFLAFTGNSGGHNSFTPPLHETTPTNPGTPPASVTPPTNTPGDTTVSAGDSTPPTVTFTQPHAEQNNPTDEPNYNTDPVDTTSDTPFFSSGDTPPNEDAPSQFETPSTVPEPGSLALTATGILGLAPLIKRRRR